MEELRYVIEVKDKDNISDIVKCCKIIYVAKYINAMQIEIKKKDLYLLTINNNVTKIYPVEERVILKDFRDI